MADSAPRKSSRGGELVDNEPAALSPDLNRRRAVFVLGKIDEILSWEKAKNKRRTRFVELREYLCEVRSKQYWRLERLKSFDEFLAKRFPDSRREAYYLMAKSDASAVRVSHDCFYVGRRDAGCSVGVHRKMRGSPDRVRKPLRLPP